MHQSTQADTVMQASSDNERSLNTSETAAPEPNQPAQPTPTPPLTRAEIFRSRLPPPKTRDQLPLNSGQRAFAVAWARGLSLVAAYRSAYPTTPMPSQGCWSRAKRLTADPRVIALANAVRDAIAAREGRPAVPPGVEGVPLYTGSLAGQIEPPEPQLPPEDVAVSRRAAPTGIVSIDRRDAEGERYLITRRRVAEELALMGFARMSDFLRTDPAGRPYIDLTTAEPHQLAAIQEVTIVERVTGAGKTQTRERTTKIKLADKRAALLDLARMAGWLDAKGLLDDAQASGGRVEGTGADAEARLQLRQALLAQLADLAKAQPMTIA